jgi:hypothetical protein
MTKTQLTKIIGSLALLGAISPAHAQIAYAPPRGPVFVAYDPEAARSGHEDTYTDPQGPFVNGRFQGHVDMRQPEPGRPMPRGNFRGQPGLGRLGR